MKKKKLEKEYTYLVGYFNEDGNGTVALRHYKRIRTLEDIDELNKWINKETGNKNSGIFTFTYLGRIKGVEE